jgi:MinD-like ATPase involved in chromosome partitioning or flagellar assembly
MKQRCFHVIYSVATQMLQAIATVQSAAASMKTFALETQDQQAKQTFQQLAQNLDSALDTLKGRQKYIEQEEPQYKQQ